MNKFKFNLNKSVSSSNVLDCVAPSQWKRVFVWKARVSFRT